MKKLRLLSAVLIVVFLFVSIGAAAAPAKPAGLKATVAGSSSIKLSWKAVSGAATYQVYMGLSTSSMAVVATVKKPTFTATSLTPATKYLFKIRAKSSGGSTGPYSATVSAKTAAGIAAPKNLKAKSVSATQISLTWDAVSGAKSYTIYRATSLKGVYEKVGATTARSFANKDLKANKLYYFKVRAVNAKGEGVYSAAVSAHTRPSAPTGLKAAAVSSTSIQLTWTAVSGAAKYLVYRSGAQGGTYAKIGDTVEAKYKDTGLHANTTYYYKVSAASASGEGSRSRAVSGKTSAPSAPGGLPAPQNFSAQTYSYQSVQLYYDVVQNAVKYRIYYATTPATDIGAYDCFDWASKNCRVIGLNAGTTYYFRVAAVDSAGRAGTPTGFVAATTAPSPGNPPQPKFYLNSISNAGSNYRMNFYRGTNPIYQTALEPEFEFYTATTQSGLSQATPEVLGLEEYAYMDVPPGQSRWFGFKACYGPYKSTMQMMHLAALTKPLNVQTSPISSAVQLSWDAVYGASGYNVYYCVAPPDPTRSWPDFRDSALGGGNLVYKTKVTSTSATFSNMPNYSSYYYIVVPVGSSGVEGYYCGYAIGTVFY